MTLPQIRSSESLKGGLPINILTDCTREKHNMHLHNYTDLYYVFSGSLTFTVDGQDFTLTSGSCVFIPPFTPHMSSSLDSDDTPIIISASFFDSFLTSYGYDYFSYIRDMVNLEGRKIRTFSKFDGKKLELANSIVKSISAEFQRKKDMSLRKIVDLLAEFLSLLCESEHKEKIRISESLRDRTSAITLAVKYIANNFNEKLTIEKLAQLSAMSRATFIRNFELICRMPVSRFIFLRRISKAAGMLLLTEMSLSEIAKHVGLNNKARLCTAFQEVSGMTTTEYRKKNRPKEFKSKYYIDHYWGWLEDYNE